MTGAMPSAASSGEIVGLLLAAGKGRRFGSDKLMHPLADGLPMALVAAANLRPACDRVVVVLRAADHPLAGRLVDAGCEIVVCPEADGGMGHSLAAGVRATADAAGWVVALADMPFIQPSTHRAIAAALRAGASLAAPQYQGRRGHPVGFAGKWLEALSALSGDHGGRAILGAHRAQLMLQPVDDPGVLMDVDRPEQLPAGAQAAPSTD